MRIPEELPSDLSKEQIEAITHFTGPCLVAAGPGSGKTRILIDRLIMLTRRYGVPPSSILTVTFSNNAVLELQTRLNLLAGNTDSSKYRAVEGTGKTQITIATLHAFSLHWIRKFQNKNIRIVSDKEKKTFVYSLKPALALHPQETEEWEKLSAFLSGSVKDNLTRRDAEVFAAPSLELNTLREITPPWEEMPAQEESLPVGSQKEKSIAYTLSYPEALTIAAAYSVFLSERNLLELDLLIPVLKDLLLKNKAYREEIQDCYPFVLVDEAQDVSSEEYDLLRILCEKERNFFAVGDDDQAIYAFRGKNGRLLQRFLCDYPDAKLIKLQVNYRCHVEIVKTANCVIQNNRDRISKKLMGRGKEGPGVLWYGFPDEKTERQWVVLQCRKLLHRPPQSGLLPEMEEFKQNLSNLNFSRPDKPLKIAVLLRTGAAVESYRKAYERTACREENKNKPLLSTNDLSLLEAYCRVILGEENTGASPEAWQIIWNRPERYLPYGLLMQAAKKKEEEHPSHQRTLRLQDLKKWQALFPGSERGLLAIENLLTQVRRFSPARCLSYLCRISGIPIPGISIPGVSSGISPGESVSDVSSGESLRNDFWHQAKQCRNIPELLAWIQKEKEKENGRLTKTEEEGLYFYTIHASKGLEFDYCFLPQLNEGIFPGRQNKSEEEIAEERRLFYVALTRARYGAFLTCVTGTEKNPRRPSRFLLESGLSSIDIRNVIK